MCLYVCAYVGEGAKGGSKWARGEKTVNGENKLNSECLTIKDTLRRKTEVSERAERGAQKVSFFGLSGCKLAVNSKINFNINSIELNCGKTFQKH